ncbi:retroviral-like aspartic protease family protein [Microbulbifer sp. TYP-18]|uniref:retroviral-like aspartic protease family protein n=1 Tax=Microbulbifer sp. TYP-18 TaxID=3230024 RepID=UPI0034C6C0A9
MKIFFLTLIVFISGLIFGWNGHQYWSSFMLPETEMKDQERSILAASNWGNLTKTGISTNLPLTTPMKEFKKTLSSWNIAKIIDQYNRLLLIDDKHERYAYLSMGKFFQQGFDQGEYLKLIPLLNSYLQINDDDQYAIYLLAESYKLTGDLVAAIKAYYRLEHYTYEVDKIEDIKRIIKTLVQAYHKKIDPENSGKVLWPQMLEFYEELALLDPNDYSYLYRQAEIHYLLNDYPRSLELLDYLLGDLAWGKVAQQLKTKISSKLKAKEGIDLRKVNGHFIVSGVLGGRHKVELLIDTGATISVISSQFFQQLNANYQPEFLSKTVMNTANGQVVVPVYRFDQFSIDGRVINDIEFAVMSLPGVEESQGLLGMNYLKNFRFNIDQENSLLFLDLK